LKKNILLLLLLIGIKLGFAQNSLPPIKIKSIKGTEIAFNDLFANKDTITIVSFWATWCGPCIKELDAFSEQLEPWQKELPIRLIGISVDDSRTSSKVKSFVKGRGWDFPVYQDVNNDLKRAFNIPNVPHTIAIKNGKILFQTDGYIVGNEEEIIEKIKKTTTQ
jgi:cytochrome c biogenesis protein CcmG, thiol:disulfide interchange protein DsbE